MKTEAKVVMLQWKAMECHGSTATSPSQKEAREDSTTVLGGSMPWITLISDMQLPDL